MDNEIIPESNKRLRQIVEEKASGNTKAFAALFSVDEQKIIYQQRIYRLINKPADPDRWPTIPQDVLEVILNKFSDIDAHWLVTGAKKETGPVKEPDSELITLLNDEIEAMRSSLDRLSKAALKRTGSSKPAGRPEKEDLGMDKKKRSVKGKPSKGIAFQKGK